MSERPKVGVAVAVFGYGGCLLMGKRKGSNGAGTWSFPGGHLEFGETLEECVRREVAEETGITLLKDIRFVTIANNVIDEDKHYITIFFEALTPESPKVMEPDKCEEWRWVDPLRLPHPLFSPVLELLAQGNGTLPNILKVWDPRDAVK